MSSREIVLWLDEHWYDALERHIKGKTLQECRKTLAEYREEILEEEQEAAMEAPSM